MRSSQNTEPVRLLKNAVKRLLGRRDSQKERGSVSRPARQSNFARVIAASETAAEWAWHTTKGKGWRCMRLPAAGDGFCRQRFCRQLSPVPLYALALPVCLGVGSARL